MPSPDRAVAFESTIIGVAIVALIFVEIFVTDSAVVGYAILGLLVLEVLLVSMAYLVRRRAGPARSK